MGSRAATAVVRNTKTEWKLRVSGPVLNYEDYVWLSVLGLGIVV